MKRNPRPPQAPPLPPPLPGEVWRLDAASHSLSPHRRDALMELELDRIWVVFWLALAALSVALISLTPVMKRWVNPPGQMAPGWDRWIYLLLFFGVLQAMYVIHFVQLSGWFSLRMSAVLSLALACVYAAGLALFSFAGADSEWVAWLDLADEQQMRMPARWCLVMLCLLLPLAFYQGKVGLAWRQQEQRS